MPEAQRRHVLALDFGGTKLAAAMVDLRAELLVAQLRAPTQHESARQNLETMIALGKSLLNEVDCKTLYGIGISFGGPLESDRRHVARSMHVPGWEGIALADLVSKAFQLPTVMDNDANAAALGEWRFGAGRGSNHVVYIQISTGIGAGLILNRQLYRGTGLAGEFGHFTVQVDGPLCTCGKHGCVESFAAGWAIARDGRQSATDTSDAVTAEQIVHAATAGSTFAANILARAFTSLGIGIANVINLLAPDLVVLGGGVSKSGDLMLRPVLQTLDVHLIPGMPRPPVVFSRLEHTATLFGAAALVEAELPLM